MERFSKWLHEVETAAAPGIQSKTSQKFKQQLQGKLKSISQAAASGRPTADPQKVVNDLATQMLSQGDVDVGGAAELAGAMDRTKRVAQPKQPGRIG